MLTSPVVTVSLDFEMRWGMHDVLGMDKERYRANIEQECDSVKLMLKLLQERGLRATWACVGAIGCDSWEDYFSMAPPPPRYHDHTLAVSPAYEDIDPDGILHFSPATVRAIAATEGQDLGTHTFSHIYCREPGVTEDDVCRDLAAAVKLWEERFGRTPVSLVFPRNQVAFEETILKSPIRIWRGTERRWYQQSTTKSKNTLIARMLRLRDSLNPFLCEAAPIEEHVTRSSLFLRLDLASVAWKLHLQRIRNELHHLTEGDVFHIWWHPHNLGPRPETVLPRVRTVLDLIAETVEKESFRSMNMSDLVGLS